MHWTSLLARRHASQPARVIADLPCGGCGYNLRGLVSTGACPECGRPVEEALCALQLPPMVESGLRTIAYGYVALVLSGILLGISVLLGSVDLFWLFIGGLLLAAGTRVVGGAELWLSRALRHIPVVGPRVRLLWFALIAELLAVIAAAIATFAVIGGTVTSLGDILSLAWLAVTFATAMICTVAGTALADLLGYDFVRREFRIAQIVMTAGVLLALLCVATVLISGVALALNAILAGAILFIGIGYLVLALLHTAGAAQRGIDRREDVLGA